MLPHALTLITFAHFPIMGVSGTSQCPGSSAWVHASAKLVADADDSCDAVKEEMLARVSGQPDRWHDPHNNGTYTLLNSDDDVLKLQRHTGNGKYVDKLTFSLSAAAGGGCTLAGCSESQVTSVYDGGTNYCNLRMLYCGSADGCKPVLHDFATRERSVATSSAAAAHDLKLCLAV